MPTVLDAQEVATIMSVMEGKYKLITALLYGADLRLHKALRLRVKDIDFTHKTVFVFPGKGGKDRSTLLPHTLIEPIKQQIEKAEKIHKRDVGDGFGLTSLPPSLI